jgi:hypothetical protein
MVVCSLDILTKKGSLKMYKKSILQISALAFYLSSPLIVAAELSNSIISKINSTTKQSIYSVADTVRFDGQVIRADEIVFAPNSVLEISNLNQDWVAIVADKIKFTAPLKKATIKRSFDSYATNGSRGSQAGNGANGKSSGRHGSSGGAGKTGGKGGNGQTLKLPTLYIITNEVLSQKSSTAPDYINLKLIFPGLDGGNGGTGGIGGKGGNGGSGRKGSDGLVDCKSGAGDGGTGGTAGKGGQGGNAGNGGQGGNIVFVGSTEALEVLSYSIIINTGGDTGIAGQGGSAGSPGAGGNRGNSSRSCGWGDNGSDGVYPSPRNLGNGGLGSEGKKGTVDKIDISNVSGINI